MYNKNLLTLQYSIKKTQLAQTRRVMAKDNIEFLALKSGFFSDFLHNTDKMTLISVSEGGTYWHHSKRILK